MVIRNRVCCVNNLTVGFGVLKVEMSAASSDLERWLLNRTTPEVGGDGVCDAESRIQVCILKIHDIIAIESVSESALFSSSVLPVQCLLTLEQGNLC